MVEHKFSETTKHNCLHTLKEELDRYKRGEASEFWDEYDLIYLIELVKKDTNNVVLY